MQSPRSQTPGAMGGGPSHFSGGIIVPLMNRTHYDFGYLGNSATETIDLVPALQVPFASSAVLVCRVHVNNIAGGATIDISCYPTAPAGDDPQQFTDTVADLTVQVVNASTMAAPFYLDASLSTPPKGGWWKVNLKATQPATAQVLAAQLSAFLVPRNG